MFIFYKLVLGHLIADFFLQFEELYRLKLRSQLGHFAHVLIHFCTCLLLVFPDLDKPFIWIFVGIISLIHFFQDGLKYSLQEKHPRAAFPIFILDQILHILFLAGILLFPVSKLKAGFPDMPVLNVLYLEENWTKLAIVLLVTTLGGSYLLHNFRRGYFPSSSRPEHGITTFEILHGGLERTLITAIFATVSSVPLLALSPAVGILRLPSVRLKNVLDFILSFLYAAALGLLLRKFG